MNIVDDDTVTWKKYRADDEDYGLIRSDVIQAATNAMMDKKQIQKIVLGLEEAVANVISYAYEFPGYLWVGTSFRDNCFILEIVDYGIPFDPLAENITIPENITLKDIELGGHGIRIIRSIFDKVEYNRKEFKGEMANRLLLSVMIKKE
ncbi:MAG: ATP-binding protein [Anaerovibrio sp.]|uniref:ATP-binding protein n=1 Tax=Anaerovibrio sp. TaxID=1872532 RepID=UPI0025D321E1|nr:ATP-binding protein [Anaerovibrio sp.]MCR5175511.1 ATP-binding protein [Anaerovibrio sp.]